MPRPFSARLILSLAMVLLVWAASPPVWGQQIQGQINLTVLDQQGAAVPGAKAELKDLATNQVRTGETPNSGTYSFVNLPPGKYKLTVSKDGFQTSAFDVVVQAARTTDVEAKLTVGAVTQVIEVGAVAPVIDTTTNAIATNVNIQQLENLPILGRDIGQLARLTPGYSGVQGSNNGTWNGLPSIAQGNNIDGVIANSSRMKFGGNAAAAVSPRLENIAEMTVSTDQLDVNQAFGTSSMQISYVTRRGGSEYHGRIYWDHRNSALNTNSWSNNATRAAKPQRLRNEAGGSVGGPVWPAWKDKLYFFFSLSTTRQPGSTTSNSNFLTSAAQAGAFTYTPTAFPGANPNAWTTCNAASNTCTANLFQAAQAYNTANGTNLPTTLNSVIGTEFNRINQSLSFGTVSSIDPLISNVSWLSQQPTIEWYPTYRIDYTATEALRFSYSFNKTLQTQDRINQPYFPGPDFANTAGGNKFRHSTHAFGAEWTISPTLLNAFRAGFLSFNQEFVYDSPKAYLNTPFSVGWPLVRTTMNYYLPVTTYYPVVSFSDTLTWQKSSHTMNFGMSWYRETNRYFNPPEGIAFFNLGLAGGDPALTAFTNVPGGYQAFPGSSTADQGRGQSLYALLAGRLVPGNPTIRYRYDSTSGQYDTSPGAAFNLLERATAWALFFQDSWRLRPNFTLNYGVRLDFTGDSRDVNRAYHNADESSLYGPSGIGNLFMPGTLTGNQNPTLEERKQVYEGWTTWQPNIGFAYVPRLGNGILGKVTGREDLVVRASVSYRAFTPPYQYFWNNASNYGSFFYQFGTLNQATPGTMTLGQPLPPYLLSPSAYSAVAPASQFTFNNGQFNNGINGFGRGIGQPYTLAWTVGIQRKFGSTRALEFRYSANSTKNQWISYNLNEVNIFENGFLQEFINAQSNYNICVANAAACVAAAGDPVASNRYFSNLGLAGQVPVPILTAAFTGSLTGAQNVPLFRGSGTNFITLLTTGQAGAMANTLSGATFTQPFFCNLVGVAFTPCATNILNPNTGLPGFTGVGAGFPINFFQANPYGARIPVTMMNDDGYSNYNSLQIDFRQQMWHGLQFDANYTWSHTLGVSTPNDWTGSFTQFTLRDLKHSYGPTLFDLRHVMHVSATYDLPFGKGKRFGTENAILDKVIGGWTVGTIMTWQTGFPGRITSAYLTFNNLADSGINLNGVTRSQLQNAVGVYHFNNTPRVSLINPNFLNMTTNAAGTVVFTSANQSLLTPSTTPGEFQPPLYIYGPKGYFNDLSLTKAFAVTERWRFNLQALFINAFNHPVFGQGQTPCAGSVRGTNWCTASGATNNPGGFGRQIELRLNISF